MALTVVVVVLVWFVVLFIIALTGVEVVDGTSSFASGVVSDPLPEGIRSLSV